MLRPIEQVLSRLRDPKRTSTGWSARCPAHDDHKASLSVSETNDGIVLLKCHAGCDTDQIVEALGLTLRDLFPEQTDWAAGLIARNGRSHGQPRAERPPPRAERPPGEGQTFATARDALAVLDRRLGRHSCHWTYTDAAGQPVGLVARWDRPEGKTIRPISRRGDGWVIGAMPDPRLLYRLPEVLAAEAAQPVLVVEGEKCVEAARSLGLVATTSVGGAAAAGKSDWSPLRGRTVWVLPDADDAGRRYAQDVTRLAYAAGAAEVRIVPLPGLPAGGDIVDWIDAQGHSASPETLRTRLLELAVEVGAVQPHSAKPAATDRWPEIRPFEVVELPRFPTQALPPALRRWVECEAVATQTPTDLAGLLVLAVVASVIARRVEVEARPGWREPTNLFVAVLLEPGNRKSAVFAEATHPLRELEAEAIELARPAVARAQSERRQVEAKLRRLEKQGAEKDDRQAQVEACALAEQLAVADEATLPRWLCDDATAERLGMLLAEQGGRIASMSAEGGVFDLMAGLYSKNAAANFGVYLLGHSGDDLITDRVNRPSLRVRRPALTCAYTIQPQVIRGLAGKETLRGRGLLARFLYALPASQVGHRQIAPPLMPAEVAEGYRLAIRALAERLPKSNAESDPLVLRLTPQAHERLLAWETEIEAMLADDGAMELIRDWGAKLAGATLRIAAALHCIERLPDVGAAIDAATLKAAVAIGRYLIPHAAEVLGSVLADADCTDSDARYILRWIRRHHCTQFSRRELYQGTKNRFPQVELIDPALNELVERGYIRPRPADPTNNPGRPSGPTFEVHPAVFTPKVSPQNPQNGGVAPGQGIFGDFGDSFGGLSDTDPSTHRPAPDGVDGADDPSADQAPRPQQSERPDLPPHWNPDDVLMI
jgi:putative DNA primase/helicase